MILNNYLFTRTSLGALLIIFSYIIKYSNDQIKELNRKSLGNIGNIFFIVGWISIAYILSFGRKNKLVYIIPSLIIVGSVIMMYNYKNINPDEEIPMAYILSYGLSWIIIGFCVGSQICGVMKYSGLIASALILMSTMHIIPYQMEKCIVNGPGIPFFVLGWCIIILLNSLRCICPSTNVSYGYLTQIINL